MAPTVDLWLSPQEKIEVSVGGGRAMKGKPRRSLLAPLWHAIANLIPNNVAPNVLSAAGLIALLHAFYLSQRHIQEQPLLITGVCLFFIVIYQAMDAVDGIHARNIRNESIIGELVDHGVDSVGRVFLVQVLCDILEVNDIAVRWMLVQIACLMYLFEAIKVFRKGNVYWSLIHGPVKPIFVVVCMLTARFMLGPAYFWLAVTHFQTKVLAPVISALPIEVPDDQVGVYFIWALYCLALSACILEAVMLTTSAPEMNHHRTRNGLLFCLLYRFIPAVSSIWLSSNPSTLDIICDGLFLAVVASDLQLGRRAKRNLHPMVVIFAMLSVFSSFLILLLVAIYYVGVVAEIAQTVALPIVTVNRNVYVDGIYDMCHIGHYKSFERALTYGNRLFVGVINDEDASVYKRPPIMSAAERSDMVLRSQAVHKVIHDAPCNGLTAEFLEKHNIHVVCHSTEYDNPEDHYYAVPRALGMTQVMPRTPGMSTSELIRRILRRDPAQFGKNLEDKP